MRRRAGIAVLVSAALAASALAVPSAAQGATTTTAVLPWTTFGDIVAVGTTVVVSGGTGSEGLALRNADGSARSVLAGIDGGEGMALSADRSTLFVALPDTHAVVAVDTVTWQESDRFDVGGSACPDQLAVAGGRVWFSDPCTPASTVRSLQPSTGAVASTSVTASDPLLAAAPGSPDRLVVAGRGTTPASAEVYAVSGSALNLQASFDGTVNGDPALGDVQDLAVDSEGLHVDIVGTQPWGTVRFALSDGSLAGQFSGGVYPRAVATTPSLGGLVATGFDDAPDIPVPSILVYRNGDGMVHDSYSIRGAVRARGLVWSPDGGRLYAVAREGVLRVVADAGVADAVLAVDVPASALMNTSVTVSGYLRVHGSPIAGAELSVRRDSAGTSTVLPTVQTAEDGSYSFQAPLGTADALYTVGYAGTSTVAPVRTTRRVVALQTTSTLTMAAPATVARTSPYALTGTLTSGGSPVAGASLTVERTDLSGTTSSSVSTEADGTFSVADTPAVGGDVAWTVSWAGTVTQAPAQATRTVAVSRSATSLSLTTDRDYYAYGATAKVRIVLGPTYSSRVVSIYARKVGATASTLLAQKEVGADGSLTVPFRMTANTTFLVRFAGDYRYAYASAQRAVWTRSKVTVAMSGYRSRSGSTYTYSAKGLPRGVATVYPARPGWCFGATIDVLRSGRWVRAYSSGCLYIGTSSSSAFAIQTSGKPGKLRLRITLPGSKANASSTSGYVYITLV
ncbi:MAG: hypothetical protein AB7I24_08530 [Candidatus Nanopelagicales bacterium]